MSVAFAEYDGYLTRVEVVIRHSASTLAGATYCPA